jgi:diguanylate cyclase (GGDEF)-like protein
MTEDLTQELNRLIRDQINLPSPPAIAVRILETVQNKDSSMKDLEKIISADPALTGKMLRIANSTFYSLPSEITNVSRALSILGTNVIKNIALSFVIAGNMHGKGDPYFDFEYFWRRAVTAAVAAKMVMALLEAKDEDIFVTGLLKDLGVLTMYLTKGQDYAQTLQECRAAKGTGLVNFEQEKYHYDHQQLGYILLQSWDIPETIITPILYHHDPAKAPEQYRLAASVLNVANLLSIIYSDLDTNHNVKLLEAKMSEFFDIPAEKTRTLIDEVAQNSVDILKIFELDPGQMKPYSQMLQEANDELSKLNFSYEQLVLELKQSKVSAERFAEKLRRANAKLEELAFRDGLTGLYNHRYFQETLDREIARVKRYGHPLSLLLFDIDFFKKINDNFGHPAGDQVLINLAQCVSGAMRPTDIIARYGGEEFAVILPETNLTGMKVFAERLRRSTAVLTTVVPNNTIQVTISCGGALFAAEDNFSKQDLIDSADRALYLSKQTGRNRTTILPIQAILQKQDLQQG